VTRVAIVLRRPRSGERRLGDCERAALRAGLALGRALGAEVEALALGGPRELGALTLALRAGCARAVRIDDRGRRLDYLAIARGLRDALGPTPPALVLCGAESGDGHGGAIGPALAHLLERPHVADVVDVRAGADGLEVHRRADGGVHRYRVPLPAVLCVARFPATPPVAARPRPAPPAIEVAAIAAPREPTAGEPSSGTTPTRRTPPAAELLTDPAALARVLRADR
jgi:electron transfer flavoprotein alpha/beta subunit